MRIINTYREPVPPSDVLSPEDILRICCKPTPVDECSEVGRLSPYEGADAEHRDFDEQAALEQARAENPGKRIIGVRAEGIGARPGQPCGEMHEKWTGALNCCDEVEPMVWDSESSVEVLAPGTRGIVGVIGGAPPYHWSVRGTGFSLNPYGNLRDGFTDTPYVWIYALPLACGFAPIEVTDGCSVAHGGIRSTIGKWVEDVYAQPCDVPGVGVGTWGVITESISGEYKVRQSCLADSVSCGTIGCGDPDQYNRTLEQSCRPDEFETPCFSLPPEAIHCPNEDGGWYSVDAANNRFKTYHYNSYTVYRWVC